MRKYRLSFSAASLALAESIKVAEVYDQVKNWIETREILIQNNILQSRTISRGKRLAHELITRLSNFSDDQVSAFLDCDLDEQKLLLWFILCKTYPYIGEFAVDVLHQKFLVFDMVFNDYDYNAFFLTKLDEHEELERITESTRKKMQSTILLMMRQADLLTTQNQIIRVLPTSRLAQILEPDSALAYHIYPAFPEEFEKLLWMFRV